MAGPDSNLHVKEYLKHYITFKPSPFYAVLLNGPWGVGKTFVVRQFLDEHFKRSSVALQKDGDPKEHYIYVSLFGMTRTEEIDAAILRSMYPALGWKATRFVGRATKAVVNALGGDIDLKPADVLKAIKPGLYVFDDLERSNMHINEALGYINEFVEHDGCKVLIVANEAEIPSYDDYKKRREKVVGKVLEVQSALDEALKFFIESTASGDVRKLFETRAPDITQIYKQSKLGNLRILQQTMWDFERVFEALTKEQRASPDGIASLLQLFFALSFELKSGRISASDLASRMHKLIAYRVDKVKKNKTPLVDSSQRYPDVNLDDTMLPDETLDDILVKGLIDSVTIQAHLNKDPRFAPIGSEQAWRIVWHRHNYTDEEVMKAATKMEEQFSSLEFRDPGTIAHVFGLQIWISDTGFSGKTRTDVVRDGKQYIDKLERAGLLEPLGSDDRPGGLDRISYDGLGITYSDTPEFKKLYEYLEARRIKVFEKSLPTLAKQLLKEMEADVDLFHRRINVTDYNQHTYYNVPILAHIVPTQFVSCFLLLSPSSQRRVFIALKNRYQLGHLREALKSERRWFSSVCRELLTKAKRLDPIGRHRVESYVAHVRGSVK
jgi:hypothetical protein